MLRVGQLLDTGFDRLIPVLEEVAAAHKLCLRGIGGQTICRRGRGDDPLGKARRGGGRRRGTGKAPTSATAPTAKIVTLRLADSVLYGRRRDSGPAELRARL